LFLEPASGISTHKNKFINQKQNGIIKKQN